MPFPLQQFICLLFWCGFQAATAGPPAKQINYSLDAALGGGIVKLGDTGEELRNQLAQGEDVAPDDLDRWIEQLASDSFEQRESATRQLLKSMNEHPGTAIPRVQLGLQSPEPEVRNRCKNLLSLSPPQMLDGLIEWIYLEKITGMLDFFQELPPTIWNEARTLRMPEIVEGIVVEEDRAQLLGWTQHTLPMFRQAGIRALTKLGGDPSLAPLALDPEALVRLEMAVHWGKLSDPRCVALFKNLVGEQDFLISSISAYALHQLSGEFLGFPGTAGREKRKTITADWSKVQIDHPKFPLQLPHSVVSNSPTGRKLFVLDEGVGLLRTYDQNGKLIATRETSFTSSANDVIPMNDGMILLCGENLDGTYSWNISSRAEGGILREDTRPSYPCPTLITNGNLLLCEQQCAYEIDPAEKQILNLPLKGQWGRNSWRTHYGTTVVAVARGILEFDQEGALIWQHNFGNDFVTCCQGLRNGNILVILRGSNRVVEITHDHQIVWEWKPGKGTVRDSFMLPSGHLLATTDAGAMEVSRGKHILWEIEDAKIWQVRRGE